MARYRLSDEERERLLSSDPDPATEQRWQELLDDQPKATGTFGGHFVELEAEPPE